MQSVASSSGSGSSSSSALMRVWVGLAGVLAAAILICGWVAHRCRNVSAPRCMSRLHSQQLLPLLRAGDLILTATARLHSVRFFNRSRWTHTAMIYQDPETMLPYVWEFTMSASPARLMPWSRFVQYEPTPHIAVRFMRGPPLDLHRFRAFIKERFQTPFAFDVATSVAERMFEPMTAVPYTVVSGRRPSSFYCAQLVLETLHKLGVVDQTRTRDRPILPSDFTEEAERDPLRRPPWCAPYSYTHECLVVRTVPAKHDNRHQRHQRQRQQRRPPQQNPALAGVTFAEPPTPSFRDLANLAVTQPCVPPPALSSSQATAP